MSTTSQKNRPTNLLKFSLDRILSEDSLPAKKVSEKALNNPSDVHSLEFKNFKNANKTQMNDGSFQISPSHGAPSADLQKFLDAVPNFGGHGLHFLTGQRIPGSPGSMPINPFLLNPLLSPKSQLRPEFLRQLSPNNPFGVLSSMYQRSFSLNHSPELNFPASFHDAKLLGSAAFLEKQLNAQQQFLKNAPLLDLGMQNYFNNEFLNFAMSQNAVVATGKKMEHGLDISPEIIRGPVPKRKADPGLRTLEHSPEMSNAAKKRLLSECTTPKTRSGQYLGLLGDLNPMDDHISDDPIGYREDEVIRMESLMTPEAIEKLSKIPNLIGDYICQLCKNKYLDAFQLAQHKCSNIMQVEYKCPECAKKFNCPANLASHRRWHRPKSHVVSKLPTNERQIAQNQDTVPDFKKSEVSPQGFRPFSPVSDQHILDQASQKTPGNADSVKKCKNCHRVFKKLLFLEKHQIVCNKTFEMQSVAEPMVSMEESCFSITKEIATPIGVKGGEPPISPLDGLLRIVDKTTPMPNQTTPKQGSPNLPDVISTPLSCLTQSSKPDLATVDNNLRTTPKANKCLF